MKKIAFAINAISIGGAERVMTILCSRFSEKDYEVHLICNYEREWEYPVSNKVKRHVIGNAVSSFRPLAIYQRISRMRRICKKEKFDVLVAFMGMNEYSVFATCGLKTKNIISTRIAPEHQFRTTFKRIIGKLLLPTASGAVFQTEQAKEWFPKRLQKRSTVIFNPIASSFYSIERKPEPGLLVATGRLTVQKNYPMLFRAFTMVAKSKDITLEVYGMGEDKEQLANLVRELKMSDRIKLCGQSDNIPLVLSRAELFLLSSDYEGLPNALMEALAVGVPCVATDCLGGGSRLLIGNNERGILVPCRDTNAFADAIKLLLEDNDKKESFSKASKQYAQQFSVDNCFNKWEEYINKFL